MESPPFTASQDSECTAVAVDTLSDEENTNPVTRSGKSNISRRKAEATVTPNTFTRFFTPRPSCFNSSKIGTSRQIFKNINANRTSNIQQPTPIESPSIVQEDENDLGWKIGSKRKINSLDINIDGSSPLKRLSTSANDFVRSSDAEHDSERNDDDGEESTSIRAKTPHSTLRPIRRSTHYTTIGKLLSRETGSVTARQNELPVYSALDWQYETSNFYSTPEDSHLCDNLNEPTKNALPFCSSSCNTNSLVAIGDEEGGIRLLETSGDGKLPFSKTHLAFRPHTNAIINLEFSSDDLLLATASGDQTTQIIDMPSQRAIYSLAAHKSSVKQAKFQPGNSSIIATSSRDGSVRIWDLRCKGSQTPAHEIRVPLDGPEDSNAARAPAKKMTNGHCVDAILDAHSNRGASSTSNVPLKKERLARHGDISVTAISFLSPRHQHLLITASEGDATVKLWDLRTTHSHRRSADAVPLSSTRQPDGHARYRSFGITSLALNSDSSRLFTLCRDNTIYAYSTSHLILGHAPELTSTMSNGATTSAPKSRFTRTIERPGLGPIYGFRHPEFHATSFYVRIAVRPAQGSQTELLAAGSSDGCAVVWPTDERYTRHCNPSASTSDSGSLPAVYADDRYRSSSPSTPLARPSLPRARSNARLHDTIPIYDHGTALIRGHEHEVTGLSWAYGGELVTTSDDFTTRCWREDRAKAKDLRVGGETGGRRWGCGWADVRPGWDD